MNSSKSRIRSRCTLRLRTLYIMVLLLVFTLGGFSYASSLDVQVHKDIESILNGTYKSAEQLGIYDVRQLVHNLKSIEKFMETGEVDFTSVEDNDGRYLTSLRVNNEDDVDRVVYEIVKINDLEQYIRRTKGIKTNKGVTVYGYSESAALDLLVNMRHNRLSKIESYYDGTRFKYNKEICYILSTNSVYYNTDKYEYKRSSFFNDTKARKDELEKMVVNAINKIEVNDGIFREVNMYMLPREVSGIHGLAHPNIRAGYGASDVFVMGRSGYFPKESTLFTAIHELGHIYNYQVDNLDSPHKTTVGFDATSRISKAMRRVYPSFGAKGLNCAWEDSPREKFADDFAVYHMGKLGYGKYKVRVNEPYKSEFAQIYSNLLRDNSISQGLKHRVSNDIIVEYKGVEVTRARKDNFFPSELLFSGNTTIKVDMRGLEADSVYVRERNGVRRNRRGSGSYNEEYTILGSRYIGPKSGPYAVIEVPKLDGIKGNSDVSLSRTPSGARYFIGEYVRGRRSFPIDV